MTTGMRAGDASYDISVYYNHLTKGWLERGASLHSSLLCTSLEELSLIALSAGTSSCVAIIAFILFNAHLKIINLFVTMANM